MSEIVAAHPKQCVISWKERHYYYLRCSNQACGKWFWFGDDRRLKFCSSSCQTAYRQMLRTARNRRYVKRKGLLKGEPRVKTAALPLVVDTPDLIAPNMVEIVAANPEQCRICWKKRFYTYVQCTNPTCGKWYWRKYGSRIRPGTKQVYCTDPCAKENGARLRRARDERYRRVN